MSNERTYFFCGPNEKPPWRERLRRMWGRLRWWAHWGRHTKWMYADTPPVSTVEEALREVMGQRPGWNGPGWHILIEEVKPEGEPFGWMALPVTVPKGAVVTDARLDFGAGGVPRGRLRIRRERKEGT